MVTVISEFSPGTDGRRFTGTCTQASSAMALTMANHLPDDYQSVVALMHVMRDSMSAHKELTAENGAATISNMANELRRRGADIDVLVTFNERTVKMTYDWVGYLRQYAGIRPIVLQLAKSYNLGNILPGVPSPDRNPRTARPVTPDTLYGYHAIAVLGKQSNAYICGDPDLAHGSARPMLYSKQLLEACWPCAMIGLNPKVVIPPITQPGDTTSFPAGWEKQDDGYLAPPAPDGKRYLVRGGILAFLNGKVPISAGNVPIEEIHRDSDGNYRQTWLQCRLRYSDADGGSFDWLGIDYLNTSHMLTTLQGKTHAVIQSIDDLKQSLS
jgi:hypothetical protein